jgi:8-oxo-dGTP pyrophosphatase MutT (NUDIX family)
MTSARLAGFALLGTRPPAPATDWRAFSRALKKLLWGPLLSMLHPLGDAGWNDGGCRVLADANLLWLPRATRYVVTGTHDHGPGGPAKVQHVLVRVGDRYLDGDGASTEATLLKRWRTQEDVANARLAPDPAGLFADSAEEIPQDREMSEEIAAVLRNKLSALMPADARPAAALVIAQTAEGLFAAIRSHKHGGRVCFPGGTIEPRETPAQAAARELGEETGLEAGPMKHLGTRDDSEHVCALFLAPAWHGALRSSREGEAFWATERDLTGASSAFPEFNRWAFERLAAKAT